MRPAEGCLCGWDAPIDIHLAALIHFNQMTHLKGVRPIFIVESTLYLHFDHDSGAKWGRGWNLKIQLEDALTSGS